MHSASSRFNGITLFTGLVLALMCAVNYFHGVYLYNPQVDVSFEINSCTNFVKTYNWDQASFKYSMLVGTFLFTKTCPNCILGI